MCLQVPSALFLADVLIQMHHQLDDKLFKDDYKDAAAREGAKIKRAMSALRYLFRNSFLLFDAVAQSWVEV